MTRYLDDVLTWSLRHSIAWPLRYTATAVVVVLLSILRTLFLGEVAPFMLFLPIVLAVGLLFGFRTGMFAAVVATLVAALTAGRNSQPEWLSPQQWTACFLFLFVSLGLTWVTSELRAVFARAQALTLENMMTTATLEAVFENAPIGLSLTASNGTSILVNEQMRRMVGRDIGDGGIDRYLEAGAIHADGSAYALEEYPQVAAIDGVATHAAPFLIERPDGSRLRTEVSAVPLRNAPDAVTAAVTVVVDVEDREKAIEHQALLTGELAHRVKNTMAMMQAIVHQSLRTAESLDDARQKVGSRFEALSRAQGHLTRRDWKTADLLVVVGNALETFNADGRISVCGVAVELGARAALSFTLVLHELATNAVKYGALSTEHGFVEIEWRHPDEEADQIVFAWQERGGPEVAAPTRRGFGSRLIDTLGRSFGGRSEIAYERDGVRWNVVAATELLKEA